MGKKSTRVIKHEAFQGKEPLTPADIKPVTVANFTEAGSSIYKNWDRTPLAFIGMTLSEDNSLILNSNAYVLGDLPPQSFPTGKLWNFKEKPQLKFGKIDLSKFVFMGSMESELLDHDSLVYTMINKKGATIPMAQAFLGFSL